MPNLVRHRIGLWTVYSFLLAISFDMLGLTLVDFFEAVSVLLSLLTRLFNWIHAWLVGSLPNRARLLSEVRAGPRHESLGDNKD